MILLGQLDSPFVRRVAITLRLYGMDAEHRAWSVWGDAEQIAAHNPLRRVPTLVLDDGTALVETFAILDALDDRIGAERALLPRSGALREAGLRLTALVSGVADKAVSLLYEGLFRDEPAEKWTERCRLQIVETLDHLEQDLRERGTPFWLGAAISHPDIATACTLRFIREAHPDIGMGARWPKLSELTDRCEARPEFRGAYQPIRNVMGSSKLDAERLELVIVDKNDSSWSMRPWLLLVHFGIPFAETSFVASDPRTPKRLLRATPTGKVPALRIGEQVIWESLAIIETIAELFPKLPIWPRSLAARRHARAIAAEMHAGFPELRRHCTMNLALRTTVELDPARRRELDRFERIVEAARRGSESEGPFLFGEFSAADAMLAPVATRIRSYGLEVGAVTRAWTEAIFALPAFQRWEQEAEWERSQRPPAEVIGVPRSAPVESRVPDGPAYAVIFSNQLKSDTNDYEALAERMVQLASGMPGYLHHESARGADGFGITVSYWSSLDAVAQFRAQTEHAAAQATGRAQFYSSYDLHVARVERHTRFDAG
jgi:glutathione S-transferase